MQKIFRLLLVAVAIIIGIVWFSHWSRTRGSRGAVQVRNQSPNSAPKSTAPESAGGNSAAPATTNPAEPPAAQDQSNAPQEVATASPEGPMMVPQHPGPITEQPAANALSPHPPSGFVTPATQKFALYRQGDLTYRLNTQSGQACVLLATDALWQKPLVYQHGCGNR
jgi:hypothetical protein